MKKIIAMLLAVMMVVGMFAACGNDAPETTAPVENNDPVETTAPVADGGDEEIPTLIWYQVGGGQPANYDSWKAKMDAYLEEKIGVHLDVRVGSWGDWGNLRSVTVQTNEPYDLMFTDMSTYTSDVNMGAFADITDLMAEVPGLTDLIPQDFLNACMIGGKLYGIPCYKDSSMTNFFVWTKADVEAYFPEYADAHTLAAIDAGLRNIAANVDYPALLLNQDGLSCVTGNKYDACTLGNIGIGIAYNGGTEFVSVYEQPDVLADLALLQSWMADGIINSEAAVTAQAEGMCAMGVAQGWPGAAKGWGDSRGTEVVVSQFENTVLSNDTVMGSITCISNSSEHKLEALKLLELVNTDSWVRDMLWYGEEGYNWEYVDENGVKKVQKLEVDDGGWTMAAYTQGTFFVATPEVGSDGYGEVKVQNENAVASPAMGFIPDTTNIKNEIAAVQAIFEEYKSLIMTGTGGQDSIDDMLAAMRDAGFDTILTEVNAQFNAWKGN
ncbi:MAG: ABC transporter substrate-binding protein [Oscillospiraceae bacterium]|nr:ABC transporter substrate-binding protein [Oscillospiraceae bacterium]